MHPLLRFTLVGVGLYLLWFFGYERSLAVDGKLDSLLTHNIAVASAKLLQLMQFNVLVSTNQPNLILFANQPTVLVGAYCDGLVLYALFSGFVLAFPGATWHKLWFIPSGIAILYSINILRIVAVCLNHHYSHHTVEFNHHYTFAFIMYGCICLLWTWWLSLPVNRLAVNGLSEGSI
jgi:exosortase/archaeosortase family protein